MFRTILSKMVATNHMQLFRFNFKLVKVKFNFKYGFLALLATCD